jgi:iron complex transport system substrate-binding protein
VVVSLHPDTLADVWRDIEKIGEALHASSEASTLVASLRSRLADIEGKTSQAARRPRVAAIEWIEPIMASGNWIPELVRIGGGESIFGEVGRHSSTLEWDALVAADPDELLQSSWSSSSKNGFPEP